MSLYEDAVSLPRLAQSILDAVVSVFEQAGVDLPERRYTVVGAPAHDCEQVTVEFQQLYLGPPGDQAQSPQHCDAPRTAYFQVEIARAVPVIESQRGSRTKAPAPDAIQEVAEQQMLDAYLLLEAGANAVDEFGLGTLADVAPGDPAGGFQGMTLNLTLAVP
jgi:hypothetical protein